jgi:hypothetical protein
MKILGVFALRFAIIFGLLICPWPGFHAALSAGHRVEVRWLVHALFAQPSIRVEKFSNPRYASVDTVIVLPNPKNSASADGESVVGIPFDTLSQGWIPLAMFIALNLATPLPWSNRWKALLIGALVIEILVAGTVWVSVCNGLTSERSPAWSRWLWMFANRLLVENVWFSFVPPFLLWAGWVAWSGHWKILGSSMLLSKDQPPAKDATTGQEKR